MNKFCESYRIQPFFSSFQNYQIDRKPGSVDLSPDVMSDHASIFVNTGMQLLKNGDDVPFVFVVGSWNLSNPYWHVYFSELMTSNPNVVFDKTHMCNLKTDENGKAVKENDEYVLDGVTNRISFDKYDKQVNILKNLLLNEEVHVFLLQEATISFNTKLREALGENFYVLDGSVNPSFPSGPQRDSGTIVVNLKYFDVRDLGVKLMKYPINADDETKLKDQHTKKTWDSRFFLSHVKLNVKPCYSLSVSNTKVNDPTLIFYSCHVPGNGSQYPVAGLNVTKNELLKHISESQTCVNAFISDDAKNYFETEYNDLTRGPLVLFALGDFNTEFKNMKTMFDNTPIQILDPVYFTHANTKSQCTCYDHALVYSSVPGHTMSLLSEPLDTPSVALVRCLNDAFEHRLDDDFN